MRYRLQNAHHNAQVAGKIIISQKTAYTKKRCKVCKSEKYMSGYPGCKFLSQEKPYAIEFLVKTTTCLTYIRAASTSSATVIENINIRSRSDNWKTPFLMSMSTLDKFPVNIFGFYVIIQSFFIASLYFTANSHVDPPRRIHL